MIPSFHSGIDRMQLIVSPATPLLPPLIIYLSICVLFSCDGLYIKEMMREAMEKMTEGIKVGGQLTNALRFADDQAMIAAGQKGLQRMMDRLNKISEEYDMKINIKKTKIMRISSGKERTVKISIDGKEWEQVGKFCYLGSMITSDAKCHVEIRRIAMGKDAFYKRKDLLRGKLNKT